MDAVIIRHHGGPEMLQFEDGVPEPEYGQGEVLVRVHAVGVNHGLDMLTARGVFGAVGQSKDAMLPRIPGADIAGVVEAVGEGVDSVSAGDRVMSRLLLTCGKCRYCRVGHDNGCLYQRILGVHRDGGAAELATLPEQNVWPMPAHLSFAEAAAIPVSFGTAWQMLVPRARVGADDWVLIVAAGSGLSVAGLLIAKLFGARVIAAAGSDWKLERAREIGADAGVNYETDLVENQILGITGGAGVDVVFDGGINQTNWDKYEGAIANFGRIVVAGTIGDDGKLQFDIRRYYRRQLSFIGSSSYTAASYWQLIDQFNSERFKPVVHKELPLSEVAEAHRILDAREAFGKVVLSPELERR